MSYLSRGAHTLAIPMKLFSTNRARLCEALLKADPALPDNTIVVLQGGKELTRYSTDLNPPAFRQESFFFWAFGVPLPDCFSALNVRTGKSMLFVPEHPDSYAIWAGKIDSREELSKTYEVDHVFYVHQLATILTELKANKLLLLNGLNSDSDQMHPPAKFPDSERFSCDLTTLFPVICECRVFKTDMELEVLRYAAKASSDAHKAMMRNAKAGLYEYQNESYFLYHSSYNFGCRHAAYTCIAGSGANCAVLHYGHAAAPNDKQVHDGDLCLCDMGAEYFCYGSDITCTFPVNGKFTPKQAFIYNAVLASNLAVQKAMKPGVSWVDMHMLAERVILQHLVQGGVLTGDIEQMMKVRLCAVFMPHGLGHFLGLDTHDVGGYPAGSSRIDQAGLRSLRTTRTLQQRMYITIEPGCYFIDVLMDKALADPTQAKFINKHKLEEFRGFGGVRIEDDVVVTATGIEDFTQVPRTVEDIEKHMAG